MVAPAPSWNTCRVYGTWHKLDGSRRTGKYKVTVPVRVTNSEDDVIVPAGVALTGTLETDSGVPSLDILVPATDDPDNFPHGWQLGIEVTFDDGAKGEKYTIDAPVDGEVNLRAVVLVETIPAPKAVLVRDIPGGLASLDETGKLKESQVPEGITGLDVAALASWVDENVRPDIPEVPADLEATLDGKVDRSEVSATLSGSTDTSIVRRASGRIKAETAADGDDVVNLTQMTTELATKANTSDLAAKADLVSGVIPTAQLPPLTAGHVGALPVEMSMPKVYALAANTWPSPRPVLPGYSGPLEWYHGKFGEVEVLPAAEDMQEDDVVTDLAP